MIVLHPCPQKHSLSSSSRGRRKDILKLFLLARNNLTRWLQLRFRSMRAHHRLQCLPPILNG